VGRETADERLYARIAGSRLGAQALIAGFGLYRGIGIRDSSTVGWYPNRSAASGAMVVYAEWVKWM